MADLTSKRSHKNKHFIAVKVKYSIRADQPAMPTVNIQHFSTALIFKESLCWVPLTGTNFHTAVVSLCGIRLKRSQGRAKRSKQRFRGKQREWMREPPASPSLYGLNSPHAWRRLTRNHITSTSAP